MTIKTKFSIDDKVYFIFNNKVYYAPIRSINIQITHTYSIKIKYTVSNNALTVSLCEDSVFKTKEDLLKSL